VASKKNVLSAMVGLAMLALPAGALAGHHQDWDDHPRPYAWHDQGWHRGWFNHHGQYAVRPIEDEDDQGEHCHFRPSYQRPAFPGTPLTTREKGTLIGGVLGAGGGALIGSAIGAPGAGAAIGGVAGAGTGYLVGNQMQNEQIRQYYSEY
jgi:hypothetical protein